MSLSIDKNQKKNYIKITLYQSELCKNCFDYIPYNISIKYNDSMEYLIEKISTQNKKFNNKIFNFNINSFSRNQNNLITITTYTKSLFVIKNTFSKLQIPINYKTKNKQKQYFYLKDNNEEIILKILLSIESDILLYQNNSMNHLNRSEISYDIFNQKSNLNLNNSNLNLSLIQSFSINNKSMINLNQTNINNLLKNKNQNQLISILENESDNNTITFSDNESEKDESDLSINKINLIISKRADFILEQQKKIDNQKEQFKNEDSSYIKKSNILIKENDKLKNNIRILEKSKKIYETKIINYNEKILNYEKKINKFNLQNELSDFNKEIFSNINSILMFNTKEMFIPNKNILLKNLVKKIKSKNQNSNISINIELTNTQNTKKLKKEFLTSTHLNSTNFTSNFSNESIINKHHSPSSNNIIESKKNKIQINSHSKNSLDYENMNLNLKNKNSNKELIDNIKVIRIKNSNSKNNIIQSKNGRKTLRHTKKRPSLNSLSKLNANTFNLSKHKKYPSDKNNNHFIPNKISDRNKINYINCSCSNIISNVYIKSNVSPSSQRFNSNL